MAEAFNKYFYSMFTHAPEVPLDAFTPSDGRMPVLDSLVLCEDKVYKVLLNLDPSKAPGPGGLLTIVLKTSARELQCSSDVSEPKYTRNSCQPNTRIRVCIYAHMRIQHMRVCLISMYELTYCFLFS